MGCFGSYSNHSQLLIPCNVEDGGEFPLQKALSILKSNSTCDFGNGVGLICKSNSSHSSPNHLLSRHKKVKRRLRKLTNPFLAYISRLPFYIEESICLTPQIKALISYGGRKVSTLNESATSIPPQLIHMAGPDLPRRESISFAPELPARLLPPSGTIQSYRYEAATRDSGWMLPSDEGYHAQSATLAHERTLAFMKNLLNGPHFDLEQIWNKFSSALFEDKDIDKIMASMVRNPRVKYTPTNTYVVSLFPLLIYRPFLSITPLTRSKV